MQIQYRNTDSLEPLLNQVKGRAHTQKSLLVLAIDGRSGAGKTTIASEVAKQLQQALPSVTLFHLEDMYQGWDGLAPALADWHQLVDELRASCCGTWTSWDWNTSTPLPHQELCLQTAQGVAPVLVGEGVGAFCADVDITCWVERSDGERKEAAIRRDGATYEPFWDIWANQEEELMRSHAKHYETVDFEILNPSISEQREEN